MATDRRVDRAASRAVARGERTVYAGDLVRLQLPDEGGMLWTDNMLIPAMAASSGRDQADSATSACVAVAPRARSALHRCSPSSQTSPSWR